MTLHDPTRRNCESESASNSPTQRNPTLDLTDLSTPVGRRFTPSELIFHSVNRDRSGRRSEALGASLIGILCSQFRWPLKPAAIENLCKTVVGREPLNAECFAHVDAALEIATSQVQRVGNGSHEHLSSRVEISSDPVADETDCDPSFGVDPTMIIAQDKLCPETVDVHVSFDELGVGAFNRDEAWTRVSELGWALRLWETGQDARDLIAPHSIQLLNGGHRTELVPGVSLGLFPVSPDEMEGHKPTYDAMSVDRPSIGERWVASAIEVPAISRTELMAVARFLEDPNLLAVLQSRLARQVTGFIHKGNLPDELPLLRDMVPATEFSFRQRMSIETDPLNFEVETDGPPDILRVAKIGTVQTKFGSILVELHSHAHFDEHTRQVGPELEGIDKMTLRLSWQGETDSLEEWRAGEMWKFVRQLAAHVGYTRSRIEKCHDRLTARRSESLRRGSEIDAFSYTLTDRMYATFVYAKVFDPLPLD